MNMENFFMSFRDPSGGVAKLENRLFRFIKKDAVKNIKELQNSNVLQKLIEESKFIKYRSLEEKEKEELNKGFKNNFQSSDFILEHPLIFFPSYPYEWPSEMLFSAAMLTLELAEELLEENFGIKDATPYNILFDGKNPIFIDLGSVEKRNPFDPVWLAYGQFVRMFLLPLFLNKQVKKPLSDIFLNRLDGIEVNEIVKYLKWSSFLNPFTFSLVGLPYLFSKNKKVKQNPTLYKKRLTKNSELSKYILKALFKRNRKILKKLKPEKETSSKWFHYMETKTHYSDTIFSAKEAFVKEALELTKPAAVLDIGCNTGHFSFMAADKGSRVVSIDYDEASIGSLWEKAVCHKKDILPLVVNICRPSPSIGWNNQEYLSFLQRAKNKFDMVFMLAVVHHMIVTDRIPMEEIALLISKITKRFLIVEFVENSDPMFIQLVKGRENLYLNINLNNFKKAFLKYFIIKQEKRLQEFSRIMFLMEKKENGHNS